MRFKGFIGPSYTLQSKSVDAQRCVNMYPEIDELRTGKEGEVASLVSTPGLQLLCTLPTSPVRGDYTDTQGGLWAVGGNVLYSISSTWVPSAVGTLNTSVGPVSFSDNGQEGVVVDGPYGYSWVLGLSTGSLPNGYTSTITAAGITTLTVSSTFQNYFTGTQSQLVTLPVASTMAQGDGFNVVNLSTQPIIVQTSGAPSGAYSITPTASGTTTLTVQSATNQFLTGTANQTIVLPVASTLPTNQVFMIVNLSTGVLTVQTSGGNTLEAVQPGTQLTATCITPSGGTGLAPWTPVYLTIQNTLQLLLPNTQTYVVCTNPQGGTSISSWSTSQTNASQNTFQEITDPNFLGALQVVLMDGYFIFIQPNTRQFFLSPLNAVTPFSGLDIASAEAGGDLLIGEIESQEYLYLFSQKHFEVWYDAGSENFPFLRIQGAVSEIGCAAAFSICKIGNIVLWLGQDKDGKGIVYSAQGYQPQRISTFAIENIILGLGDISGARAWTYQQGGHGFYCLNITGATTTLVYDLSTNLWHERAYLFQGQYQRHLGDSSCFAFNTNIVGDYSSGNIYSLTQTVLTDNGNPIVRERRAPHIAKDMNRIFHGRFILDIRAGVGLSGTTQGTNPQAILDWSDDGGESWSNEKWAPIGPIGKRKQRVIWRRLGQSRDRVYRVRISDPVHVTLIGAQLDIDEGAA